MPSAPLRAQPAPRRARARPEGRELCSPPPLFSCLTSLPNESRIEPPLCGGGGIVPGTCKNMPPETARQDKPLDGRGSPGLPPAALAGREEARPLAVIEVRGLGGAEEVEDHVGQPLRVLQ